MDLHIQCLCVDATDPRRLAGFWEAALGWRRTQDEAEEVVLEPPEGTPEDLPREAPVSLGARRADIGQGPEVSWIVLRDPEGNEFCVLQAYRRRR
jgi:predicted enzyme related to lactoylglutathione lyase